MSTPRRRFVIVSGLPASGKSTLARKLNRVLMLPVLDKDVLLEALFESEGAGDMERRRELSRESDLILQSQADASDGAILVSFWHLPGMPSNSGTPTGWLLKLPDDLVNVHCVCSPEIAAERFFQRKRHPGHLDRLADHSEVLASLRAINRLGLGALEIGERVKVDTSAHPEIDAVLKDIHEAFRRCDCRRSLGVTD